MPQLDSAGKVPPWVLERPKSPTHFIGIASAPILEGDLYTARKSARSAALKEIAEQIRVTVSTSATICRRSTGRPEKNTSSFRYFENIHTAATSPLTGWEEVGTWLSPEGYYWSMVILDREIYFRRSNRESLKALGKIVDALNTSSQGPLWGRIRLLHEAMLLGEEHADSLSGLQDVFPVAETAGQIETSIERLLQSVLLDPSNDVITLSARDHPPDSLSVRVLVEGIPDASVPIRWSISDRAAVVVGTGYDESARNRAYIANLPPSQSPLVLDASLELGDIGYDLLDRGYRLPSCSILLHRRRPRMHPDKATPFCRSVMDSLFLRGRIIEASSPDLADFTLGLHLQCLPVVSTSEGGYRIAGELMISIASSDQRPMISECRHLTAESMLSPEDASRQLGLLATEAAIHRFERVF